MKIIEKELNKLNNLIPEDKLKHFFYGTIIYIFLLYTLILFYSLKQASLYSFSVVCLIGGLKEFYDYLNKSKHTPDIKDFVFTIISGLLITITYQFH
jgi:hypothetical protein